MPITRPNPGDVVASTWGQAVADAINTLAPQRASSSADLTLTTTFADLPTASYTATPTTDEWWLVLATFDFDVTVAAAGTMQGVVAMDGAVQAGTANADLGAVGRKTTSTHTTLFPTAGAPHTVKLQANKTVSGGTAVAHATHSRITVIRFAK